MLINCELLIAFLVPCTYVMPSCVHLHVHAMLTSLAVLYIVRLSLGTSECVMGQSIASDLRVEQWILAVNMRQMTATVADSGIKLRQLQNVLLLLGSMQKINIVDVAR